MDNSHRDFRADLHCHSICSDGSDDPFELLKKAKNASLQGISITDHDTTAAYTPELFAFAEEIGLRILPGVEISSELEGIPVHILAYGYDMNSVSFATFLREIQRRRTERNQTILKKLADRKMVLEEEDFSVFKTNVIGRPHIAALMVKKGYVSSIQDAFERYLKDQAPCYSPGFKFTPQEVIEEIHLGQGKAVLAHPHFYKKQSYLNKILSASFDGVECYYAALPKEQERPWVKLATERGWIATGGSDYHGSFKSNSLGSSWVGEKNVQSFACAMSASSVDFFRLSHPNLGSYAELIGKLLAMPGRGVKTFEAFQKLNRKLGSPHSAFRSIHVGGTNGKGSVSAKIAEGLRAEGYRVGLYTSPHISCVRERILIDGEMIPEEAVVRHLSEIFEAAEGTYSFFDFMTALAFLYFREIQIDWAVIEVGLGGRLDATNVIHPELSVITSIGYDHMEILGDTLEKIAQEKAGIIKRGIPLIAGPHAAPFFPSAEALLPVEGDYDAENSAIATLALRKLGVSEKSIKQGIRIRPKCRFEIIGNTVLDAAHNPDGFRRLIETLSVHFPKEKFHFIVAFSKDKEWKVCLDLIRPYAAKISFVNFHSRFAPLGGGSLQEAFEEEGGIGARKVICGSFYLMAEARRCLGIREPRDPE